MRVVIVLACLLLTVGLTGAQESVVLTIRTPVVTYVPDEPITDVEAVGFSVIARLSEPLEGESISMSLFNGLQHYSQTKITNTSGWAEWDVPAAQVTQSGYSLVIARYHDQEVRSVIQVVPGRAAQADVITTANTLLAYGEGRGTLIVLERDAYGNPVSRRSPLTVNLTYPGGLSRRFALETDTGLAWTWFDSRYNPGRLLVTVEDNHVDASLEVRQVPGETAQLTLELSPHCVASKDGRELIRMSARALDAHGFPVVDGTLITFRLGTSEAYGQTADGASAVTLPAPTAIGTYTAEASNGAAHSNAAALQIVGGICP